MPPTDIPIYRLRDRLNDVVAICDSAHESDSCCRSIAMRLVVADLPGKIAEAATLCDYLHLYTVAQRLRTYSQIGGDYLQFASGRKCLRADSPLALLQRAGHSLRSDLNYLVLAACVLELRDHALDLLQTLDQCPPQGHDRDDKLLTPPKATSRRETPQRPERSDRASDTRHLLAAALTKHHEYADGSCLNYEPLGVRELSAMFGGSPSVGTVSNFFKAQFGGHKNYKIACIDRAKLVHSLKILNDELTPRILYKSLEDPSNLPDRSS